MRLVLRAARLALGAAVLGAAAMPSCFTAGDGTGPPMDRFYFPTGLAVSVQGNVLYAINSDFDLQWNGGTLQSYNLFQIRQDATTLINANLSGTEPAHPIPFVAGYSWVPNCMSAPPPPTNDGTGIGVPLGESCAPPMDSSKYIGDKVVVGAFATDLQLAAFPYGAQLPPPAQQSLGTRLFAPVAGNATVTWAKIEPDNTPGLPASPAFHDGPSQYAPFALSCGQGSDNRCDGEHEAGNDASSPANSRNVTMPGEPFGLAQSADATALTVTSETATQTSLLTSGVTGAIGPYLADGAPTMQFVVDNMPNGGVGIVAVPHDPNAVRLCELHSNQPPCVRQAFLQTSRQSPELDLLRYYDDDGSCSAAPCGPGAPSVYRPFLQRERAYAITSNSSGTDFRGIAFDISNRIRCESQPGLTQAQMTACGQLPARLFIASRTPPSLVVGQVGATLNDGSYDPDSVTIIGNVPLTVGPSKVYVAPITFKGSDGNLHYQLKVFVVCFDSNAIYVFNPADLDSPSTAQPETIVATGTGPYAMAFDPFVLSDAAQNKPVPTDSRTGVVEPNLYRYAYIASFTHSYVQVIDLNQDSPDTFESVVFTLGKPAPPKGQ
jgi:hypothetical protein